MIGVKGKSTQVGTKITFSRYVKPFYNIFSDDSKERRSRMLKNERPNLPSTFRPTSDALELPIDNSRPMVRYRVFLVIRKRQPMEGIEKRGSPSFNKPSPASILGCIACAFAEKKDKKTREIETNSRE
ncbi:hypothetical protein [Porphyromonas gingivalis]|nr:hypothetical protein [Porphyromonas gingivalis]MCE8179575.1 hypothetical protein [Porphyromonas gingivalis]